jgi:tetratricopeptide (TPR) repeat protein
MRKGVLTGVCSSDASARRIDTGSHSLHLVQKQACEDDWWWQLRLGMCYYQLGLFNEAIRQFELSLQLRPMDETVLHLNKAYLRIDQPLIAAKMFRDLAEAKPGTRAPRAQVCSNAITLADSGKIARTVCAGTHLAGDNAHGATMTLS